MNAPDARALVVDMRDRLVTLRHANCTRGNAADRDPDCDCCAQIVRADAYLAVVYEPPAPRKRTPQETGAAGAARSKVLRAVRATRAEAGRIGGRVNAAKRAREAT